jgi:spore photoproduct lyase
MTTIKVVTKEYELLDGTTRTLVQRVGDGSIIKRFEKTPLPRKPTDVVCPHFLELKWALGCPFDCAWCYLKGTLRFTPTKTRPHIKEYSKIEQHVRAFIDKANGCQELLNTGELADSLMWEKNGHPFSRFIISLFSGQESHRVLFLTKSDYVDNFLAADYRAQAVVSFSLNADAVARRFEKRAPEVTKRIQAATKLSHAGYEVRIRIDPMVPIAGWEWHYISLIDRLFSSFVPARITLGSLRGLQSTINEAVDKSWVAYLSESSNWGRKISFKVRHKMYERLLRHIRETYRYTNVALCKETLAMWHQLGMDYRSIRCNCIP